MTAGSPGHDQGSIEGELGDNNNLDGTIDGDGGQSDGAKRREGGDKSSKKIEYT